MNENKAQQTTSPAAGTPALHYGSVFDHMLEGCQIISRDFRYLYVNDVVARQGHNTKEKLLGKTMAECYPGIEKSDMFARLQACIEHGQPQTMENEFRFPDGAVGWFELRMDPLPEGAIILSIDITDRKNAEERGRQLEELKNTFVKIASHQLRTPLATIRGSLENLRDTPPGEFGTEQRQQLHTAYEATATLANRLSEMIAALDIEEGSGPLTKQQVTFETLWLPVFSECKRICDRKSIQLSYVEPILPIPPIECDAEKIKLVLRAVANNAANYTPMRGTIRATVSCKDGILHFEITDSGMGIPEAEQSRVFHRFFRGSNAVTANPDATGISLAVAKYYVEQHQGRIGFSSKQNEGSIFWFEIPVK